jgi:hypothetical protein
MPVAPEDEAIPTALPTRFDRLLLFDKDAIGCVLRLVEAGFPTCI